MNMQQSRDGFSSLLTASSRSERGTDGASRGVSDSDQDATGVSADADPDGSEDGGDEESAEELPKDVQFDILKNQRRRLVLNYLFDVDNPVSLGTLSEHVAGVENDKDPRALDSQERKRAYVGLYQCHLPRMHDAGVIDFNKNRGMIELGPHAEDLKPHLEQTDDEDLEWARIYLFCSLLGLGVYLITQSPLLGIGWLGSSVLGLTLAIVAVVSTVQLRGPFEAD